MSPRIETLQEKKLIGIKMSMRFSDYKIGELWRRFMPIHKEIEPRLNKDLISMAVFPANHFSNFNPENTFERWAAVEVRNFEKTPHQMEQFILKQGLYAVFNYRGLSSDRTIFRYIFETWLPLSAYVLDDRPHLEILGEKYKNNDPESEEEIWIPIKHKHRS